MLPAITAGLLYRLSAATGLYSLGGESMVDAELQSMLAGFAPVLRQLEEARSAAFPQICSVGQLRLWERLTGLAGRPGAEEQLRRDKVCAALSVSPRDYTPEGMLRCLEAAGLSAAVEEDFAAGRITVHVDSFLDPGCPAADTIAKAAQLMPSHLEVVFLYGGPDWEDWERVFATWQDFDDSGYSWQQLDTLIV